VSDVFRTQQRLLARCIPDRWRVLLLLSVPLMPDAATGRHGPPTSADAAAWVGQFDRLVKEAGFAGTEAMACAALYWPWVLSQEQVGAPVREMPPSAGAAGIVARRDLARGPQVSPASETLAQVVGLAAALDDDAHGRLYVPELDDDGLEVPGVNVLRAFPGYGIQVWGARTLSVDPWLRFIAVRRTLTAVELRIKAALDLLVFEPSTPTLWLQITQVAFSVLLPLFESGALRGERPEEAFYVRCDGTLNPPEALAAGQLLVEVGVAVAAPAEFIAFRVGRRDGVVEVLE
jgi:phage tail sheath protein FI